MSDYERLKRMHHQQYLLQKNDIKIKSKYQKARSLIKKTIETLNQENEQAMVNALELAAKSLIKMQIQIADNPPLKKAKLDSMNGEPVWVISWEHDGRWGIVDVSDQSVVYFMDGKIEKEPWFDGRYIFQYKKEIYDFSELLAKYDIQE